MVTAAHCLCDEFTNCARQDFELVDSDDDPELVVDVMMAADRAVSQPLRELLIEARTTGEAEVDDLDVTVTALMGALQASTLQQFMLTGAIDGDQVADTLVPMLLRGLRA